MGFWVRKFSNGYSQTVRCNLLVAVPSATTARQFVQQIIKQCNHQLRKAHDTHCFTSLGYFADPNCLYVGGIENTPRTQIDKMQQTKTTEEMRVDQVTICDGKVVAVC